MKQYIGKLPDEPISSTDGGETAAEDTADIEEGQMKELIYVDRFLLDKDLENSHYLSSIGFDISSPEKEKKKLYPESAKVERLGKDAHFEERSNEGNEINDVPIVMKADLNQSVTSGQPEIMKRMNTRDNVKLP